MPMAYEYFLNYPLARTPSREIPKINGAAQKIVCPPHKSQKQQNCSREDPSGKPPIALQQYQPYRLRKDETAAIIILKVFVNE